MIKIFLIVIVTVSVVFSGHSQKLSSLEASPDTTNDESLILHGSPAPNAEVVDSLKGILQKGEGADRLLPLYDLAFEYLDRDNYKALEFISQAEQAALLSGDSLWIVRTKRVRGQILARMDYAKEAIILSEAALGIAFRNEYKREQAMIINRLAGSYLLVGQDDRSLRYYLRSLQLSEELGDTSLQVQALHNLGFFYHALKDYRKALRYFLEVLPMARAIGEVRPFQMSNISIMYAYLEDFSKAELFLADAQKDCGPGCLKRDQMAILFAQAYIIAARDREYNIAERSYLKLLSMAKAEHALSLQVQVMRELSKIYRRKRQMKKAATILREAGEVVSSSLMRRPEMIQVYAELFEVNRLFGDFEKATRYAEEYIHLKDSIYNSQLTSRLMEIEAEYVDKKNRETIEAKNDIILLNKGIIRKQRILNAVTGALVVVTVVLLVFVFKRFGEKKRLNLMLEKKIKSRTLDLEHYVTALSKSLTERDLKINRASAGLRDVLQAMQGLCNVSRAEDGGRTASSYMEEVEHTARRLAFQIQRLEHDQGL